MNLINKKTNSLQELEEKLNELKLVDERYNIYGDFNHLSSIDENTEILIIGTYIPQDLDYFHFGKYSNKIYTCIDVARNTNFQERRKRILEVENYDIRTYLINEFIKELANQHIAFLDLLEYTLIKDNEVNDNSIKAWFTEYDSIRKIINKATSLEKIIPMSQASEEILIDIIGNDDRIEYHQLINGETNQEWIDLFQNNHE